MEKPKKLPQEIKINKTVETISFYCTLFLFLTYIISLPSIITRITEIQKTQNYQKINILYTLLGFLFSKFVLYLSKNFLIKIFESQIIPKFQRKNETHSDRKLRLGNFLGGALYYLTTTIILYTKLYGSDLCPVHLGGKMNTRGFDFLPQKMTQFTNLFYFFHLGHHIERLHHLVKTSRESLSFYTMLFHHLITVLLIPLSYFCFLSHYGFAIFFLYDSCEIFINVARLCKELKFTSGFFTDLNFILFYVIWIFNRIYGFNKEVLFEFAFSMWRNFGKIDFFLMFILFLNLFSLSFLNFYWFCQISWAVFLKYARKTRIPYEEGHVEKEGKKKLD